MKSPTVVAVLTILGFSPVLAEDAVLTITPEKCVALRKGQVCYQKLRLRFSVSDKGNYCLFAGGQSRPLKCFNDVDKGELIYQFASEQAMLFNLQSESTTIASGQVTVAWVYQKTRKRYRWRLF